MVGPLPPSFLTFSLAFFHIVKDFRGWDWWSFIAIPVYVAVSK